MNFDLRLRALTGLVLSPTERAQAALQQVVENAVNTLRVANDYEQLEQALSILEVVGPRFVDQVVSQVLTFTDLIRNRPITYSGERAEIWPNISKYQNAYSLIVRSIDVLGRLRYLATARITSKFFELSRDENEEIRSKALESLKKIASYNIDVFWGTDVQTGIGAAPQREVLKFIDTLDDDSLRRFAGAIITVAETLLSAVMEGTTWTSSSVTFARGALPPKTEVAEIRERTITLLQRLYPRLGTISDKVHVIRALQEATRGYAGTFDNADANEMFVQNSVDVLFFFKNLATKAELPVIQKIESESYWIFYHAPDPRVRKAALDVEASISANAEYQIFKTLVGFEGIFVPWEELRSVEGMWEETDRLRRAKAAEFAKSVNSTNFPIWRARIISYAKTESDDLATFPVFYFFLETLAQSQPGLALQLLTDDADKISEFLTPLLHGLWNGPKHAVIKEVVQRWVIQGRNLYSIVRQFLEDVEPDILVLKSVLNKAAELGDLPTVSMVMSVAVSNLSRDTQVVQDLFLPALQIMTEHKSARWIYDVWYRREVRALIEGFGEVVDVPILENLVSLRKIDYRAEEILSAIASKRPRLVIEFLCNRIGIEEAEGDPIDGYEAVPFALQKLRKPLSVEVETVVQVMFGQYAGDYITFMYHGARLLSVIFPDFPAAFEAELVKILNQGGNASIEFVLAVLRNYDGQPFLQDICRQIVRCLPSDSNYWVEVAIALQNTGVVSGEYGFVEAYERKKADIQDWFNDADGNVREFAAKYVAQLESMIRAERERTEESIALRKHRYGE